MFIWVLSKLCSYPCESCVTDTYCLTCGFGPTNRKTSPDCNCVDHLRDTDDEILGCINCKNGYFITDSKCKYCKLTENNHILLVEDEENEIRGIATCNTCNIGCDTCLSNNLCLICSDGYYLLNE